MNFAFTFTVVAIVTSYSIYFPIALQNGGPVTMVWGWIIGSLFTIVVGLSMAEICSAYPFAGSVYNWAGQLATKEHSAVFSYVCGWFNLVGNIANNASYAYGFATVFRGSIDLGQSAEQIDQSKDS